MHVAGIPVNHEAWIEIEDGKVVVYWGHFPRVDGVLETHVIRDCSVCSSESCRHILLKRGSCSRGECLYTAVKDGFEDVIVVYERSIVKSNGVWFSGFDGLDAYAAFGGFEEARRVFGVARLCLGACKPVGHVLDLAVVEGFLRVYSLGSRVEAELKILDASGNVMFEGKGGEVRLPDNAYLVVAKRRVDVLGSRFNGYLLVATLTLASGTRSGVGSRG